MAMEPDETFDWGIKDNTTESSKPGMSELEKMQHLHEEKLAKIEELKGKKEAIKLELEKKKKENPEKMKEFGELRDKYNSRSEEYNAIFEKKSERKEK